MGNRRRMRPLTGPALVLGLLGAVLLWAAPGMASTLQQPAGSEASTTTTPTAAAPITVHANCVREGRKLRVNYTVRSWEPELTAPVVEVWFQVTGGGREPLPAASFEPGQEAFSGHFLIDAPTEAGATLVIIARAHWTDPTEKSITKKSQPLPLPVCPAGETTTTTSAPTTTVGSATSTSAVLGATSTTAGGQLPFTGASSVPTVLAGLGLLTCGAVLLWASRSRRQPS